MNIKAFAATIALLSTSAVHAQGPAIEDQVRDSWIVVLKEDVSKRNVKSMARGMAAESGGRLGYVYTNTIKGFSIKAPRHAMERMLQNNPRIDYIEADSIAYAIGKPAGKGKDKTTEDTGETPAPSQSLPWGVTRVGGAEAPRSEVVSAWVIDTGIDLDHPDLNVRTLKCANFIPRGKNSCDDGNGHGTHVAGTIGAIDNDFGVVGVAAGVSVVPVRVLDNNGSGSYSGVIAGVDYVAANALSGDVASMSLGGPYSQTLNDAVEAAASSLRFVIAAGNSSADASGYSPASAEGDNIYTVSAIDRTDSFASFSNFGAPVDFAAPGVSIESTWKGGGYNTISGTSMAAPHVAGLLLSGTIATEGTMEAIGDPDGNADTIATR